MTGSLRAWIARRTRGGSRAARVLPGVLLLTALGSGPLAAQEGVFAPVPRELTFEAAVDVALERNPAFLQQLNAVESAEYAERSRLGAFLPSLNGSVGFGGNASRSASAVDEFGRTLTNSSASQSVSGQMTILDLGQLADYRAARSATSAREAGVAAQAAVVRRQVGQAYFAAVQRARLLEVEERQLETARENLAAIRSLFRVAAKQATDVLGAELDVAQAELAVRQARGEAEKAMLVLKQNMGTPMDTEFVLAGGFPVVFDPASLDGASLLARALRENPRVAQQLASVQAAERGLSAARAARYPSISGNYGYRRSLFVEDDYGAFGRFDLPNSGWNFGVSLSLPIFNRLQTSSQVGQAAVEADNAREALRQERLQLEQEVLSARIDLESAFAAVEVAERSVEIARERLEQGQALYRQGTLDYTALQQMINAVASTERNLVNANTQFATALLVLEEKVGGPVRQ